MQNSLIDIIFKDFKRDFRYFFDPLDRGFVNEAIVNMNAREYKVGTSVDQNEPRLKLERPKYKMTQIYFLI